MGRNHYALFAAEILGKREESACFDWSGIELATGSYLKAAYLPIFRSPHGIPIFTTGINRETRDEIELALQTETRPIFFLETKSKTKLPGLSFLGHLDDAYQRTLSALTRHDDASASELYSESIGISPQIGKTAWINRLTRMYEMGLIHRTKVGKGYRYSAIAV